MILFAAHNVNITKCQVRDSTYPILDHIAEYVNKLT